MSTDARQGKIAIKWTADSIGRVTALHATFYVYVLFREDGRPFYVGKGRNGRWIEHERDARNGAKGHRFAIIRAMQARGLDVPKVKLHQGLTEEVAHAYEVALITAIGRRPHGPLVNLTDGGDGTSGYVMKNTPEARAKMSAAALGRKASPKTRAKMAAAKRDQKLSPEHVARISAAIRNSLKAAGQRAILAGAKRGKTLSPEHRAKIGAAGRGRKR